MSNCQIIYLLMSLLLSRYANTKILTLTLKNMKKYTRKVSRTGAGRSYYIVIPADIACELKIKERQKLTIHRKGNKIIIKDWKK